MADRPESEVFQKKLPTIATAVAKVQCIKWFADELAGIHFIDDTGICAKEGSSPYDKASDLLMAMQPKVTASYEDTRENFFKFTDILRSKTSLKKLGDYLLEEYGRHGGTVTRQEPPTLSGNGESRGPTTCTPAARGNASPGEGMRGGVVEPNDQSKGDEPDDPGATAPRDGLEEGEVNPMDWLPGGQPDLAAAPRGGLNDKEEEVKPKDQPIGKGDLDEVEILLVVITEPENDAVMKKLKEAEEPKKVTLSPAGTDITLGWFGGYRVALLHARMGDRCERPVRETLKALKNVDKVIAIGIAMGAYRGKQELGDVLVSRSIEYGDVKHASDVTGARGPRMETNPKLDDIFCKSLGDWSGKAFLCDHEGSRYSVVHVGLIVSSNNLWNNPDEKSKLQEAYKNQKFVGGEMEGGFICKAAEEVEEKGEKRGRNGKIAVIVIKGVSDYGDGKKAASKGWQPIAARAAASYAAYKLQQYKLRPTVRTT